MGVGGRRMGGQWGWEVGGWVDSGGRRWEHGWAVGVGGGGWVGSGGRRWEDGCGARVRLEGERMGGQ